MDRTFAGARIRALRSERGLSQVELARVLEISASYLNQIEHNVRPLTVPVLLRISEAFGLDAGFFATQDTTRLVAELSEVLSEADPASHVSAAEIAEVATNSPAVAHAVLALHRRYRGLSDQLATVSRDHPEQMSLMPHEEVRDFFYDRGNYLDALDRAAEELFRQVDAVGGRRRDALVQRLKARGVSVVVADAESSGGQDDRAGALGAADDVLSWFDRDHRVVHLAARLDEGQQVFRLAHQLATLDLAAEIKAAAQDVAFHDPQAYDLLGIGLANYAASAMVLPYGRFRESAEELHYDIERLASRFGIGFESTCHRLSTLQRPRARGVPFTFVRVDRAGNMSQRQSATSFHFSRAGGTCPLWAVYEAFATPGKVLTQVAEMPDDRRYLWVARTVFRSPRRYGAPGKLFAVALGCETRHAGRLVYSSGIDVRDPRGATPIGVGCKVCERTTCPQRAFPQLGRHLAVDPDRGTFVPYPIDPAT